ncbi:hypothetical protein Xph01_47850 [Micromonospora phaseoli]|nr:hypothetical protein Xph01_47850 [Micromonospora phaseoli]
MLPRFQPGCIAATISIRFPGGGVTVGETDGDAVGDTVGETLGVGVVVGPTFPVHATPFRVNEVGAVLLPVQDPLKPKETVAFVPMVPL